MPGLLEPGDPLSLLTRTRRMTCLSRPASWPRARRFAHRSSLQWVVRAWRLETSRAVENYQLYTQEYPGGADRLAARSGWARRAEGQSAAAGPANLD